MKKPSWFNLSKYDDSITNDIRHWIINLSIRIHILDCLENKIEINLILHQWGGCSNSTNKLIKKCRDKGFFLDEIDSDSFIQDSNIKAVTGKYIPTKGHSLASININAPVNVLVEDFKQWVLEQKKQYKQKQLSRLEQVELRENEKKCKNTYEQNLKHKDEKIQINKAVITYKKLNKWRSNQLIAYLDILIWSKQKQENPTQEQMGEWLFEGSDFDETDKFKKGTLKYYKDVISTDIIKYMAAQSKRSDF